MRAWTAALRPLPAAALGLALLLAGGCASIPAGSPDAARLEPMRQLHQRRGRLGWDGLVLGMTYREVEVAVGERLAPAVPPEPLLGCEKPTLRVEVLGTPLDLEFSGTTLESRLVAVYAVLASHGQSLDPEAFRRALHKRLDGLEFVPSRHQPGVSEAASSKALYRTTGGAQVFVDPGRGVYFGDLCVD